MKNKKGLAKVAFALSIVAVALSAIISVTQTTIWLAGTQWILIGIVLAVYAVYLNCCECGIGGSQQ